MRSITVDTTVGPFSALVREDDTVVAAGFTGEPDTLAPDADVRPGGGPIADALAAYVAGRGDALDAIVVEQPGTPLLQELWQALRAVPAGATVTYGGLAASIGRPRLARIAGEACRRNRIPVFVPCHRVVPAAGGLGNYQGGAHLKAALLDLERQSSNRSLASPAV